MTVIRVERRDAGDFAAGRVAWDVFRSVASCAAVGCSEIDMSVVDHLKPYSIACLAALGAVSGRRAVVRPPVDAKCRDHLARLGFFDFFARDCEISLPPRGSNVPVEQIPDLKPGDFAVRATEVWQRNFGDLAPGVGPALATHIDEVVRNAVSHAESKIGCVVCGQAFPESRRLELAVVDFGQTIRGHLVKNPEHSAISNDFDAIVKATGNAVTGTRAGAMSRLSEPNSGAGLHELRIYCERGGGELTILSGSSYVVFGQGIEPENRSLRQRFPGSLVNIRFFVDFGLSDRTEDAIIW